MASPSLNTNIDNIYDACPLNDPTKTIRVLELRHAKSHNAPLRARLLVEPLKAVLPYEAISYAWHDGSGPPDTLYFEHGELGSQIEITANLAAALRQFRWKRGKRRLWVDAVKKKKKDSKEKSMQVRLMGQIYARATRTLAWLGTFTEESARLVADTVQAFIEIATRHQISPPSAGLFGDTSLERLPPAASMEVSHVFARTERLIAFLGLFATYFKRLWIVQEIVLAKKVTLQYGTKMIDSSSLRLAMKVTFGIMNSFPFGSSFFNAWGVFSIRDHFWLSTTGSVTNLLPLADLVGLMHRLRNQDCTDDRDRVYALLGLQQDDFFTSKKVGRMREKFGLDFATFVPDVYEDFSWTFDTGTSPASAPGELIESALAAIDRIERAFIISPLGRARLVLEPDYNSHTNEVFTDFARAYLDAEDEDILQYCGLYQHVGNYGSAELTTRGIYQPDYLPSWVPDLRKRTSYAKVELKWNSNRFKAGKGFLPKFQLPSSSRHVVGIHGTIFDQIDAIVTFENRSESRFESACINLLRGYSKIVQMKDMAGTYRAEQTNPTGESFHNTLLRTLVADGALHEHIERENISQLRAAYTELFLDEHLRLDDDPSIKRACELIYANQNTRNLIFEILKIVEGHSFFFTKAGYMGLAASLTRKGDFVMLIDGAQTPFAVRRLEGPVEETLGRPFHVVVCPAYVHGVMFGEVDGERRFDEGWGFWPFV